MAIGDDFQVGRRVRFIDGDGGEPFGAEWDIEPGAPGTVTAIDGVHDVHVQLDDGREFITEAFELRLDKAAS